MLKILISIEDGTMRACANGEVSIYVEQAATLNGIEQLKASEITNANFEWLLTSKTEGQHEREKISHGAEGKPRSDLWSKPEGDF